MYDILFLVGLFAGWIVLNVWLLPVLGIQTCLSGACRVADAVRGAASDVAERGPSAGQTRAQ